MGHFHYLVLWGVMLKPPGSHGVGRPDLHTVEGANLQLRQGTGLSGLRKIRIGHNCNRYTESYPRTRQISSAN